MGASLKTTWLQMGFDGIKIETSSVVPPPMPSSRVQSLPSSIDVEVGSIEADLVEESGPRAALGLEASGLALGEPQAGEGASAASAASGPTLSGAVVQPHRRSSWMGLALRLTFAFAGAGVVGFVGVTLLTDGPAGVMRAARTAAAPAVAIETPQRPPPVLAEEFSVHDPPPAGSAVAADPQLAEAEAYAAPSTEPPEDAEVVPVVSARPAALAAPRGARPRSKALPPARSYDFGF
jgi:hypothetical protein